MRKRKADISETVDEKRVDDSMRAEYEAALADYYRRHPTFQSIFKSLRRNHPGLHERQLMQAARVAEDKRPKPTPELRETLTIVEPEPA